MKDKTKRYITIFVCSVALVKMGPVSIDKVREYIEVGAPLEGSTFMGVMITGMIAGLMIGAIRNKNFPKAMDKK